ncbi:MFS transporter [Leucobacter aridicollis]|uniref:EmrB/QacA subfamily drug resistance transporter n=1 Tax=Leucobacter aridicollis TaxID=283878 RepID=A0A852RBU1_9MICO|nr:MFS transporter [Leucobacter aridicollis]MBL3680745.1 MFS transporter [Leucobacter aridicollis]NYD28268.1 EmrB/QacA subfamily drug resistance transporter [Leucobacter aridicollis]
MHNTHSRSSGAGASDPDRSGLAVAVLAAAGIASSITQTMVTPLIPQLPVIFDAPASSTAWVITATLLAAAVAVPISGRLGDLFGKRRMLLVLSVPLIVGALICAVAPTVQVMIAGRALQGFGSGMVPLGIAMLRDLVPPQRLSSAIATVSATLGVGGAIGLPVSAAVIDFANWRALFFASAVITLLVALAIWWLIPALPPGAAGQRFDWLGAIGLAIGLISLILGASKGATWGWGAPLTLSMFATAVAALGLWGVWELRTTDPLVDLRTAAVPRVLLTNIASLFIGFGMYASMLVMPQLLQLPTATGYGLGQSILAAGLWMAPAGLMMLVLSPVGGRLTDARGPKFTLVLGGAILALGYGVGLLAMGSTWGLLATSLVINSGVALAYGAMPAIIMGAVPKSETAAANGFNTLMRSLGTTVGAAVIGLVLAQLTTSFGDAVVPSQTGFTVALLLGAAISAAATALAACIPRAREAA